MELTSSLYVHVFRQDLLPELTEFFSKTLNFTASPQEYSQCRHVPFTINGVVAEVRESRRESTRTASVNINVQGRDLALTAELFCGLASHTIIPLEDKYWVPTIDIKLDSVDHKSLHESPIFRITIRQWPFLRLTDLKVSYQVIENDREPESRTSAQNTWLT